MSTCGKPALYMTDTGSEDSWYYGYSPLQFWCREHIAEAMPSVLRTAVTRDEVEFHPDHTCEFPETGASPSTTTQQRGK